MEKDFEMNNDEDIKVEDRSTGNKFVENDENNQNLSNNIAMVTHLTEENPNIEPLPKQPLTEIETLDNSNNSKKYPAKDDSSHGELNIEVEDEPIFFCNKRSKKSKLAILDSDSENEEKGCHSPSRNDIKCNELVQTYQIDNDLKKEESQIQSKKLRRIAFIDSDSEEESELGKLEKLSCQSKEKVAVNNPSPTNLTNKGSIEVKEIQLTDQKKILSTLCDSESSDDNSNENDYEHQIDEQISDGEVDALQANVIVPSKSRKSKPKKTKNVETSEKMTAKKALEQKKEIFSESQRRIRESRISLPYHRPKSRSLKEFLENRPKLASALTNVHQTLSSSAAIKMSMEQLVIVSKKLKEREKEVQQFYKSESESETEDIPNDSVHMKSDDLTQETEAITDNIQQQLELNNSSEVDIIGPCNLNDDDDGTTRDTAENKKNTEIKHSLDTIPKSDDIMEVTSTELNRNNTENTNNYSFDSEEIINLNLNDHQNDDDQDENIRERKGESMDTAECPNIASDPSRKLGEDRKIESEVHRETELTHRSIDGDVCMKIVDNVEEVENAKDAIDSVDNIEDVAKAKDATETVHNVEEVEKAKDATDTADNIEDVEKAKNATESFFDKNPFDSEKAEKLIILSDIILKPGHSEESENVYTLDDELLDLASDVKTSEQESDKYDFCLDDIEDEFEHVKEDNNKTKDEKMNDNKGQLQKNRKLELLEKLGSLKPRLSGGPNEVIDLENGVRMPDEISKLRERFLQHNIKIGKQKHKKEISILSVTDGEIRKETLALNVDEDDEENTAPLEKPGVRLQKLREELENQMAQRRSDMWKEKHNQTTKSKGNNDEETDDDKSNCGVDDILDNDEEEELTESEEEDEELEENDCDMMEKKKKKSAFVEEEAEESDLEEDESEETQFKENSEEINEMNEEIHEEENEDADAEDNVEIEELEVEVPKKRVLKRILAPFNNDDSDDDDMVPQKNQMFPGLHNNKDEKVSSDDEFLPPHQPTNYKVREPIPSPTKSELDFCTPVTYMTGLQNLNTSGSRIVAPMNTSSDLNVSHISQLSADEIRVKSQLSDENFPSTQELIDKASNKNLPEASPSIEFLKSTEENVLCTQDILEICSGNFPSSSKSMSSPEISTQQLREIFTGTGSNSQKSDFNTQDIGDICSGQFTGITSLEKDEVEEIALDEREENIISQLIDEEELERFKKKFESPVASNTQKTIDFEHTEEVQGTGGVIDSEDDGDDELHLKKKKSKRLAFSDEESEDDLVPEETIDLHDEEDLVSNVEYDSEENEVDPEERGADMIQMKQGKLKASDFFEDEAELSESEWGSEDEDEKNLDDMEFEKGDEEKFDDDKLRSDIERVQMRQMLDEDNREVKLLQELLLEDGELHGTGRQRQFRWKNIDAAGNETEETKFDDGDVYLDDDESEEQWRKMRHEREMFMLKKQSQVEEDDVLIESERLSFTHKTLKIKSQTSIHSHTATDEVTSSPQIKPPFRLLNKRGSFLSRSDQILQKFAEATKVSVGSRTTSRIVFQAVDGELKKRKAASQESDSTPVALKKLRLSDLSPALQKIKPKVGKSLFGALMLD